MMETTGSARPFLTPLVAKLLDRTDLIHALCETFGSPLHIVLPDQAAVNARNWLRTTASAYPDVGLRYALKACRSNLLTKAFARCGIGADVSSIDEFILAVRNHMPCPTICVTGPHKKDSDMALYAAHGLNVHIDSQTELLRYVAQSAEAGPGPSLTLRLRPGSGGRSRFGMAKGELIACARTAAERGIGRGGISFHLNDYAVSTRVEAIAEAVDIMAAVSDVFSVAEIDIGGGFPIGYVDGFDREEFLSVPNWRGFKDVTYPYGTRLTSFDHAAAVLRGLRRSDSEALSRNGTRILMQPGRSLLDHCGMSLFRVIGTKPTGAENEWVATLDGMSFSLSETWFQEDFAPTPVVVSGHGWTLGDAGSQSSILVGRSCLESDVIRSRPIRTLAPLAAGDIVCFTNTAGYQMDSNESPFHGIPLPSKIGVHFEDDRAITSLD